MSEQKYQPPQWIVKVEPVKVKVEPVKVEEDDEDWEVDRDVELLKEVATMLRNESWLSRGSEGKKLARQLLDLVKKLGGWKKWEELYRSRGEEQRELKQRIKENQELLDMLKAAKEDVRKTHELEVKRRIEVEQEIVALKKAAEMVDEAGPVVAGEKRQLRAGRTANKKKRATEVVSGAGGPDPKEERHQLRTTRSAKTGKKST